MTIIIRKPFNVWLSTQHDNFAQCTDHWWSFLCNRRSLMSAIYTETKNIAISIRIFIQLLRLVCLVRVFFIRVAIFFSLNCCNLIYIGNLIVLYRFEACYKPVRMVNVNGKKSYPLSAFHTSSSSFTIQTFVNKFKIWQENYCNLFIDQNKSNK